MAEAEDNTDSRRMEAFDLVTEALEKIDAHQQSVAAYGRSAGKDRLVSAEGLLSEAKLKAKEADPEYFKAEYFQAMVTYLRDIPKRNGEKESPAVAQFKKLVDPKTLIELGYPEEFARTDKAERPSATQKSIASELNYNLAAALFEDKEYGKAIKLFDMAVKDSKADLEVQFLARAGAALVHATRRNGSDDTSKLKEHADFIHSELWPSFFPPLIPLVRRLRGKKPIDKQIANEVLEIIKRAEDASESVSSSDDEESDNREKVHT